MARIDDSHQPYKRTRKLGPGPKRARPKQQTKEWECRRGKRPYEQICRWVGEGKRKPTKNRMNPSKKRAYNKLYRAWAKKKRLAERGKLPGYKCRRTANTKCR